MSKDIVKREKREISGKTGGDIEVLDHTPNPFPFISFRYSYKEISSDGVNTTVKAKKKSFENGRFQSEEFEGTLPGSAYVNMAGEMQKLFANQMKALMKTFAMFLPSGSKTKNR
jgi:hypothetical protein